jgi:hypothetical protein
MSKRTGNSHPSKEKLDKTKREQRADALQKPGGGLNQKGGAFKLTDIKAARAKDRENDYRNGKY